MQDVAIPGRVIAYALWVVGAALVVASFPFGVPQVAATGVMIAMVGQVVQIRCYICDLSTREREAFEYGRESVRSIR